jgi:hypothetical protein
MDKETLKQKLAAMKPDERLHFLEKIEADAKKKMQETELMLKESQRLKKKNQERMLKQAIEEGEQLLRDRAHRKRTEERRDVLDDYLLNKKEGLEGNVEGARLPVTHPIVGLYSQLRGIQYSYNDNSGVDYARTTLLPEIRQELVAVLNEYKEVPQAMKEIADAAYRLTKDLLGERVADSKKYLFP